MNVSSKELLLYHLDHTYAVDSMSNSLASAVRGLTPAQAAWKPSAARHSIWQIVRHLAHWKQATLSALDGTPVDYDAWNQADWQEVSGGEADWERDVEHLRQVSDELRARVERMDDEALSTAINWYKRSARPYPVAHRLLNQATHDIYHAGQIQYVFALQEIPVEELTAAASRNDMHRLARLIGSHVGVVNDLSRDGWTALHVASYFGQKDAVQFLLEHGASPRIVSRNPEAKTPLHSAVVGVGDRGAIARLLLGRGADPGVRDADGLTVVDLARREGDAEVVTLLQRKSGEAGSTSS